MSYGERNNTADRVGALVEILEAQVWNQAERKRLVHKGVREAVNGVQIALSGNAVP